MIPEKIIELFKSGAVTNENNPFKKGKMTATFAYGSKKLYDFMHENDDIYMLPVSQTNNACKLKEIDDLVTVNAGVEVDFLGQVNAEKWVTRIFHQQVDNQISNSLHIFLRMGEV